MNMRLMDPLGERFGPSPEDHATIGEYLRALREHKGLTLAELADTTRIRRAYLQGLEESDRSSQPSRPFAIGYVRSYAQALGIDGDAAAARFKRETPDLAEPFHGPVGVAHDKPKRSPLIIAVIGLVISGVLLWNVVQRSIQQEDHETAALPAAPAELAVANPPPVVTIGAPTPAPAAQNLPEPYLTPGLEAPKPEMRGGLPTLQTAANAAPAAINADNTAAFTSRGTVYGAPGGAASAVLLQARKPSSLIVRGAGGAVYFARQLAVGEAYRAPSGEGLTAEVTDPAAFTLYVAGENKGPLVSQQTALDKLVGRSATPAGAGPRPLHASTRPTAPRHAPPQAQPQPAEPGQPPADGSAPGPGAN